MRVRERHEVRPRATRAGADRHEPSGFLVRNRYVMLGDVVIIATAALGAFVLRFDWFFASFRSEFQVFLIAALILKPAVFILFGMYNRYWRYTSIDDLMGLTVAVLVSSTALGVLA